jgi:hypothetical protein
VRYRVLIFAADSNVTTGALETNPNHAADRVLLTSTLKDEGGKATFTLSAHRADLEKKLDGLAEPKIATFVIAYPGDGDGGAVAAAGPRFDVLRGDRLRLDVAIDPDDPTSADDQIILKGANGFEKKLGVVSQGKMHAHENGMTTLIFEGVRVGEKYTCTIDPGAQGKPYPLFKDLVLTAGHVMPRGRAS